MSSEITQPAAAAPVYPEPASPEVLEMIEAGVFYGLKKTKTRPEMKQYVILNRGGIELINLEKTAEAMERVVGFVGEVVRGGGLPLLVATQPAAQARVLELAKKLRLPYVVNRWAGGIITNFKVVSKRTEYFLQLRRDLASGALDKYTKKERLLLEREMNRLKELFEGLEYMTKLPDVLITIDPVMHHTAVREAKRAHIPIVALANVDADPASANYLVPGNDSARRSIDWFFNKIEAAIEKGFAARVEKKEQAVAENPSVKEHEASRHPKT